MKKALHLSMLLSVVLTSIACTKAAYACDNCIGEKLVTIQDVSARPKFTSGAVATFLKITVTRDDYSNLDVYLPYMTEAQTIPSVGQRCLLVYEFGLLSGLAGDSNVKLKSAPIIDKISCEGSN